MRELDGVSMICADTTRSRAYLQNLTRAGLRPTRILRMSRPGADLPGQSRARVPCPPDRAAEDALWQQAQFDPNSDLTKDIARAGAPCQAVEETDINAPEICEAVAALPGHTVLYSGFGGQILRDPILAAGKDFLHVHGGYLPDFRGSTTNYFSMIAEGMLGASAIFLTAEIDAGPVLLRRRFPAPPDRTRIDHLHDSAARALVLCEVLNTFAETGDWPRADVAATETGRTYYVVHPVLKHLAIFGHSSADGSR